MGYPLLVLLLGPLHLREANLRETLAAKAVVQMEAIDVKTVANHTRVLRAMPRATAHTNAQR